MLSWTILNENRDGVYGSRGLIDRIGAREVVVAGGGVEKSIDLMVCRGFRHEINWSRPQLRTC